MKSLSIKHEINFTELNNLVGKHSLAMKFGKFVLEKKKSSKYFTENMTWKLVSGPFGFLKN